MPEGSSEASGCFTQRTCTYVRLETCHRVFRKNPEKRQKISNVRRRNRLLKEIFCFLRRQHPQNTGRRFSKREVLEQNPKQSQNFPTFVAHASLRVVTYMYMYVYMYKRKCMQCFFLEYKINQFQNIKSKSFNSTLTQWEQTPY